MCLIFLYYQSIHNIVKTLVLTVSYHFYIVNSVGYCIITLLSFLEIGKMSRIPSKHGSLSRCWAGAGPPSTTLAQRWPNGERCLVFAGCRLIWVFLHFAHIFFHKTG